MRRIHPLVAIVAVLAVVATLVIVFWPGTKPKYIYADFPRTVSLYEGSDVKILGVGSRQGRVRGALRHAGQGQAVLRR